MNKSTNTTTEPVSGEEVKTVNENEEKNSAIPTTETGNSKLSADPAPELPRYPVDRYVLEYWTVLSSSIAKSVATYYANATAKEVWPCVTY